MKQDVITERSVEAIAAALRNWKKRPDRGCCTLLIGAGCSISAGIPSAAGFIEIIKKINPGALEDQKRRQKEYTYADWMESLGGDERHSLLAEKIDEAKINWAHICIASLMAAGYVDRILTTNFDPLIVQACALFGEFPAVYDFAASQFLKAHLIPRKAVFYLHGQRSGFILKNTQDELEAHAKSIKPIIDEALQKRVWIVVGYSGSNDPVFNHLAEVDNFGFGLYWVGYRDEPPAEQVRQRLLGVKGKSAYYTKNYDADEFFDKLIKELNIHPPRLVAQPFTHFNEFLNRVTPEEKFKDTREMILKAIEQFEQSTLVVQGNGQRNSFAHLAQQLMVVGNYDGIIAAHAEYEKAPSPEGADYLSRAYLMKGNEYAKQARDAVGDDAGNLFALAIEQYKAALDIKPDSHEVLNNWGTALYSQAKRGAYELAGPILAEAVAKFDEAIKLKGDYTEYLINRGVALSDLAEIKAKEKDGGLEADKLFEQAVQDFRAVLSLKPNSHEALTHWGEVLYKQAEARPDQADPLLNLAIEKYQKALTIKRDYAEALNNWGIILLYQSKLELKEEEAERLVNQAMDKFFEAENRQPGSSAINLARLNAMIGDVFGCRESLKRARQYNTLPPREQMLRDSAFESIRNLDWFKEFLV